jgi:hypothetical protein
MISLTIGSAGVISLTAVIGMMGYACVHAVISNVEPAKRKKIPSGDLILLRSMVSAFLPGNLDPL